MHGEYTDTVSVISESDNEINEERNSDATLVNAETYNNVIEEEKNTNETEDNVALVENTDEYNVANDSEGKIEDKTEEKIGLEENTQTNTVETTTTNTEVSGTDYFIESKLARDTMYSQMIASYNNIIENANINETQKSIAMQEITKINSTQNSIMIAENLIKNKGFKNCLIFINDESVNVIIESTELKTEQIAQIQNIITREIQTDINNIHISVK